MAKAPPVTRERHHSQRCGCPTFPGPRGSPLRSAGAKPRGEHDETPMTPQELPRSVSSSVDQPATDALWPALHSRQDRATDCVGDLVAKPDTRVAPR